MKVKEKKFLGGAGLVALNIKSTGAKVTFSTVLGKDTNAKFVREILRKNNINLNEKTENDRPTTEKNVIINQNHRMLKLDTLENKLIDQTTLNYLKSKIKKTKANAKNNNVKKDIANS